jgi:hypothetical protein
MEAETRKSAAGEFPATELYRKVYIKDASGLPKKDAKYIIRNKHSGNLVRYYYYDNDECTQRWLQKVDWYLQPIEQDPQQKTIDQKCHKIYDKVTEAWTPDKRSFEEAEKDYHELTEQPVQSAEEILKDEMSENLWKFICSYPVGFKSDEMLKDWIIQAMDIYASRFKGQIQFPTDEEIVEWAKNDIKDQINFPFVSGKYMGRIEGAKALRDKKIPINK